MHVLRSMCVSVCVSVCLHVCLCVCLSVSPTTHNNVFSLYASSRRANVARAIQGQTTQQKPRPEISRDLTKLILSWIGTKTSIYTLEDWDNYVTTRYEQRGAYSRRLWQLDHNTHALYCRKV